MTLSKLAVIVTFLLAGTAASVASYVESRSEVAEPARTRTSGRSVRLEAGASLERAAPASLVEAADAVSVAPRAPEGPAPRALEGAATSTSRVEATCCESDEPELEPARVEAASEGDEGISRWQRVRRSGWGECSGGAGRPARGDRGGEPAARPARPAAPAPQPAGSDQPTMSGPV